MVRAELMRDLRDSRLVAVLRSKTAEEAMVTAKSAVSGGVKFVEVTLSVPGALEVIRTLASESNVPVGAGTVLSKKQADAAITAGAQFVGSPSSERDLIAMCHAADVAWYPGAATPTECEIRTRITPTASHVIRHASKEAGNHHGNAPSSRSVVSAPPSPRVTIASSAPSR